MGKTHKGFNNSDDVTDILVWVGILSDVYPTIKSPKDTLLIFLPPRNT